MWNDCETQRLQATMPGEEKKTLVKPLIHPITKERGAARLFFVKENDSYPNGVRHILRETRAQRRVKVGIDAGRPVLSDERDPNIADHGYDLLRYAVAAREPAPTNKLNRIQGTFLHAQRLMKRQAMRIRWKNRIDAPSRRTHRHGSGTRCRRWSCCTSISASLQPEVDEGPTVPVFVLPEGAWAQRNDS